jgi:hypothetical protein
MRWYGWDWSDFQLLPAFDEGCVYHKASASGQGVTCWISPDKGPLLVENGSNTPVPIYEKLYPLGIGQYMDSISTVSYLANWSVCYWNNCFLIGTYGLPNGDNTSMLIYHIPSGTWTQWSGGNEANPTINDIKAWAGMAQAGTAGLIDGSGVTCTTYYGGLWALFADPNGSNEMRYLSAPLWLARGPQDMHGDKHISQIFACWRGATEAQEVTLKVFANGNTTTAAYTGSVQTIAATPLYSNQRVFTRWAPGVHGFTFQLELTATTDAPLELDFIEVIYENHGISTAANI